jgi:hypothetical protein
MVQELLNIEQFCQRKFNKIKTKCFREIEANSWYCWKTLDEWDFLEVIFVMFRPKVGEI